MSTIYWRNQAEDEAMQDEHGFAWRAMLDTIDADLTGTKVLDVGCNRGGFLRLLADGCGIAEGYGYDLATGAIEDARGLEGGRPLHFEIGDTVPAGWSGFDVAFSHEVLYMFHDLRSHARSVYEALAPGGVYYAVLGVHADAPLMAKWHTDNAEELGLPRLYDLDEIAAQFQAEGFGVTASRLRIGFISAGGHGHHDAGRLLDYLEYYNEQKVMLRFAR